MSSEVMEHLMYHKALLDNDVDVDYYISLAQELEEGIHLSARDPVDRAIAIAFELVMEEKLNPWKINLRKFTKLYMDRIRSDREIDFIIAGKIIYMAWNILMRKSEQVLENASVVEKEQEEFFDVDMDTGFFDEIYDVGYDSDGAYPENPEKIELKEPVRRDETRPVSLFDLVSAMSQVKREMEKKKKRRKVREKFRFNLEEKVHKEDLEEEIKEVWSRISEVHGDEVALSLLYDGTNEDFVTVFIALLFLEKFGKVELEQYMLYDEIYIKIKVPEELRHVEFTQTPEISIVQL